ncbi:exodeoxyribonuclease VII large subunit [Marinobacter flavimaris]|jgi:exodeoxyribonuclease VII large subunit|uniref:Exodeoxyribonuclease 7 large subunit n=3 Tax=Marinobacter TaxID=2742 RepID=A0A3D8H7L8_9GAMM|nr:exodeoxyribonuclease VII large subunit [Marinobacter flavimaris]MCW8868877.1 exodeoxyribonuclease VII large subunit [Marinobacter sp.]PPI82254.1 exodeoxyribonuclease VII large subunit [Marinobacter flavimaris]RDU42705.1 exodeoxyribonuclease VII large subunit [Marinobacter flavimaris]HAS77962.1 exodeoxyribonuclease VII large subunit [Marinobacter adhaerens]|tara:strand:+ start:197 stop:1585 length:1389 start_codon:yes stop_codon:yes gene_type:complete
MYNDGSGPATPHLQDTRPRALSVSELNHQARHLLESSFMQVWVEGELSGFSRPSSGHWYFSLKDRKCQVRCAMFRGMNQRIRTPPKEGDQVRIRGKVTLYENRGDFQIIVEHVEPAGLGALQQAFEELKRKLLAEGLFEQASKKPLPSLPRHIGVVTSPTGAAIHDILTVLARRCPAIPVTLYPTAVQGKAATADIVRAIEAAQNHGVADVLIIGRGGGSLEDLWCFNEEAVARAIAACRIPTVSAVGHEVDVTIADFVADLRAPTPSAAAEKISPDQSDWLKQLRDREFRLSNAMGLALKRLGTQLGHLSARLRDPRRELLEKAQRMDELELRLRKAIRQRLTTVGVRNDHLRQRLVMQSPHRQLSDSQDALRRVSERLVSVMQQDLKQRRDNLEHAAQTLNVVSPLATLGRGYSIVRDNNGNIIRDATNVNPGDTISAHVARGEMTAKVTSVKSAEETGP